MKVIGIGHKARQGKNLLARYIVMEGNRQGWYTKQYAFADALRNTCRVLGMRDKNGRVLQAFGTDVMRNIDDEIWLRILADTLNEEQPDIAVISDVRFKNETKLLKHQYDGYLVKIERFNNIDGARIFADDRDLNHPSETELDHYNFDLTLHNVLLVHLQIAAQTILKNIWYS